MCYPQRYEEGFFSLERIPNIRKREKLMKETW